MLKISISDSQLTAEQYMYYMMLQTQCKIVFLKDPFCISANEEGLQFKHLPIYSFLILR